VQFQEDRRFFDRAIPEIMLYLAQNERVTNWHFVIWVARPSLLPPLPMKYRLLSPHITLVPLNQISKVSEKSLGVTLIDLIVCPAPQASEKVLALRTKLQNLTESTLQGLLVDLMETVLVYKFAHLSRKEIAAMFGLSELKQTRVYQEAKEEGVRLGEAKLLIRQLSRRFGELSPFQQERIAALSLEESEQLGEALLDFQSIDDFHRWLHGIAGK